MTNDDRASDRGATAVPVEPHSPAFMRARAAALAELARRPRPTSWWQDALVAVLLIVASTAIVLGVGAWFSIVEVSRLQGRWLPLALLVAVQVLGVVAAIAPGRTMMRWSAAVLALAAAVTILMGRHTVTVSTRPGFACSTSHLAVDLIPLALVLYFLRKFSATRGRSLLAGVAAAATGAIAGELSCGRGWSHVLIHHIGAGVAIAVACVLLSRARPPETFAP
ncbi:MAG TPA: hypothetical protein VGP07_25365 [Polyangia bacterium]|jgi:hypothetical protein